MIHKEYLLNTLRSLHKSKKTSILLKKNNIIVFKTHLYITKKDIKLFFLKIYNIKIIKIRTLIFKGKLKLFKRCLGKQINWKKIYITFKKNQRFNFFLNSIK